MQGPTLLVALLGSKHCTRLRLARHSSATGTQPKHYTAHGLPLLTATMGVAMLVPDMVS